MKRFPVFSSLIAVSVLLMISCKGPQETGSESDSGFSYFIDQFEDMRVLRYQLPGFDQLTPRQKEFIYYLGEAALSGRDIMWDQNFKYNLVIRKTIEAILGSYTGDREAADFKAFTIYAKRVFFANGIHHHYSSDKFKPGFPENYFAGLVKNSNASLLPLKNGETVDDLLAVISPVIFDPDLYPRKIEQKEGVDIVAESAVGFYDGLTQKEVEAFYSGKVSPNDPHPVSIGLNSKLVKEDGKIIEEVYRSGGLYGSAIDEITLWLEKAMAIAETDVQKKEIRVLIDYYRTGDLKTWDDYNVIWANDNDPIVDYINGFIETYEDPMGMKATWEAIVDYKDIVATKRTETITANAQWFEDNSPVQDKYKKEKVTGVAAKVINIAMLGGDCYPTSPLGINLPNADWIRKEVGSKSVTLANITTAYDMSSQGNGFLDEFAFDSQEIERVRKYGNLADALHTDLHECVGHASGKLAEGTDPNALKNYASPLEEARAELFALYYLTDPKLVELGLFPDSEAGKAAYDGYIRNGLLTQLVRIQPGKQIEQAHMRARSVISQWAYEKGKPDNIIEIVKKDGKTYARINDYGRLRDLFGQLLREIQRIKSEGDFEAGKALVENYGVKVDPVIHNEMLERYNKLNLAPYTGFINPLLIPVTDGNGNIIDVKVEYKDDYLEQMLYYGRNYSYL